MKKRLINTYISLKNLSKEVQKNKAYRIWFEEIKDLENDKILLNVTMFDKSEKLVKEVNMYTTKINNKNNLDKKLDDVIEYLRENAKFEVAPF